MQENLGRIILQTKTNIWQIIMQLIFWINY